MKWFRSNIRHGVRLALLALLAQFALSFGHFHWRAAQAAPTVQSGSAQDITAESFALTTATGVVLPHTPANPDNDQQPADYCATCAVMALASTILFATPPLLLAPQAVEFLYLVTDAAFVHLSTLHVAFQPRAPPVS